MSLVHESLVSVLNRRFVNCYYNSFPWVGHDEGAAAFAKKAEAARQHDIPDTTQLKLVHKLLQRSPRKDFLHRVPRNADNRHRRHLD